MGFLIMASEDGAQHIGVRFTPLLRPRGVPVPPVGIRADLTCVADDDGGSLATGAGSRQRGEPMTSSPRFAGP